MDPGTVDVKRTRSYDASRRRERAQRTRARIVDVAARRFLGDGYAATTVAAIASDAGVSADTIYKSFGGKPGLVRAIRARALEGIAPPEERTRELGPRESDPRALLAGWAAGVAEAAPRVAPMLVLIREAAATDAEMRALLAEADADRLRRTTQYARRIHEAGHLRPGITLADAADALWAYSAPELFELLVLRGGWTRERYGRFLAEAIVHALL